MSDDGVPLGELRGVALGVLLICRECELIREYDLDVVIARLNARGKSGEAIGVIALAQHVRDRCPRCKASRWLTRPWFPPATGTYPKAPR